MTQQPAQARSTARARRPIGVQGEGRPVQSTPVTTRLADIAAQAGVSEATVSRVLNGKPGVAAGTRESVLAALDVLGYERPVRLRRRSAGLVGLITPELENPIFPALAQVIGQSLTRQGYTPVLATQTPGRGRPRAGCPRAAPPGDPGGDGLRGAVARGAPPGILSLPGPAAAPPGEGAGYGQARARGVAFVLVGCFSPGPAHVWTRVTC